MPFYNNPLVEAFGPQACDQKIENYALFYFFAGISSDLRLSDLNSLVDPSHAGPELQGEPGWCIERQFEVGERQRKAKRLLERFPNGGHVIKDPDPEAGADPSWPVGARYKVELYQPAEFGDPKYPLMYYDSLTFEGFLKKILAVYVNYNPESAEQVEQILAHAHYWVELDGKAESN